MVDIMPWWGWLLLGVNLGWLIANLIWWPARTIVKEHLALLKELGVLDE